MMRRFMGNIDKRTIYAIIITIPFKIIHENIWPFQLYFLDY